MTARAWAGRLVWALDVIALLGLAGTSEVELWVFPSLLLLAALSVWRPRCENASSSVGLDGWRLVF